MPRPQFPRFRRPKIYVYQNAIGEWQWHLKAGNGEIQASGEGYKRRSGALQGAKAFQRNVRLAEIQVEPAG